jgi:hypothetical protein
MTQEKKEKLKIETVIELVTRLLNDSLQAAMPDNQHMQRKQIVHYYLEILKDYEIIRKIDLWDLESYKERQIEKEREAARLERIEKKELTTSEA